MIDQHIQRLSQLNTGESTAEKLLESFMGEPPFLRALLVADGTVTLMLRAYFGEAIEIETQQQSPLAMPDPVDILGLSTDDNAFYRQVRLIGEKSGTCYANAISLLNPTRIHENLFDELIDEQVGMGEVLRNSARGSYREVLDITRTTDGEIGRTYAVFVERKPAILISEFFDVQAFIN